MSTHPDQPSAAVEIVPAAPGQQAVLANLLELYAHDFSEFNHLDLGPDGKFGYPSLPLYWREPNRFPFLVTVDGSLAGAVLVKRGSEISSNEATWDMAEFFILRGYRRRGIGTRTAHQLWRSIPGTWEVRVMESNPCAHRFWERSIAAFVGEIVPSVRIEKGGKPWRLFSFESKPGQFPTRP